MATQSVLGSGPIPVFLGGSFKLLPLSRLTFEDGNLKVPTEYSGAAAYLKTLVTQGVLRKGDEKPVSPAIRWTATRPGASGNNTKIEITYATATATTFTVKVTRVDEYAGLTAATIVDVVGEGTSGKPGSRPGLAHLKAGGAAPTVPVALARTSLARGGAAAGELAIPGAVGTAFTLVALDPTTANPDEAFFVTVTDPSGPDNTFTLTIEWSMTRAVVGVNAKTELDKLAYVVAANNPNGTALTDPIKLPKAGSLLLGGGFEARAAEAATATSSARPE